MLPPVAGQARPALQSRRCAVPTSYAPARLRRMPKPVSNPRMPASGELGTIATLNRRLCEANERAQTAESRAAQALAMADRPT